MSEENYKAYLYGAIGYALNPPMEGFHWYVLRKGTHAEQGGPSRISGFGTSWYKSFEDACSALKETAIYYKDDEQIPEWAKESWSGK